MKMNYEILILSSLELKEETKIAVKYSLSIFRKFII